ncbi:CHAT domain-containing protein [Pseudonocardia charpentierae]|uniref:CHAT domain-containing protein n=1 Tax=Pseudonocardia charpentierae TaxID=3075545 RepID=A0ABU2NJ73_9PSEU|nr:CHAT domain-containing protein [Pseudonocardia sp. DSM 45834]MDT0353622.1 CHAT domain-containing protein [Pseudonocardia sp. DSM 45834]
MADKLILLARRAEANSDVTLLRQATVLADGILELVDEGSQNEIKLLVYVINIDSRLHDMTGDLADLNRLIGHLRRVMKLFHDDIRRVGALARLAQALHDAYMVGDNPDLLDEAIQLAEQALEIVARDDDQYPKVLTTLAFLLVSRHGRTGEHKDLAAATDMWRSASSLRQTEDEELADLNSLDEVLKKWPIEAIILRERVGILRRITTLQQDRERPSQWQSDGYLANLDRLYEACHLLYETSGEVAALIEAIGHLERLIAVCPEELRRWVWWHNLGCYQWELSLEVDTGQVALFNRSADAFRQSFTYRRDRNDGWGDGKAGLGTALAHLYGYTGDPLVADELLQLRSSFCEVFSAGSFKFEYILKFAGGIKLAHDKCAARSLATHAAALLAEMHGKISCKHPAYGQYVWLNGWATLAQFRSGEALEPILECADEMRGLLDDEASDSMISAVEVMTLLAMMLETVHRESGDFESLKEALAILRKAAALEPLGLNSKLSLTLNKALVLQSIYETTGDLHALQEAVDAIREAVAECPQDWPWVFRLQGQLGVSLCELFRQTRDSETLIRAMAAARTAVRESAQLPGWPRNHHSDLCYVLTNAHSQFGELQLLTEAVAAGRQSVISRGVDPKVNAEAYNNLAVALKQMFHETSDPALLDEAESAQKEALDLTPLRRVEYSMYRANYASTLIAQYRLTDQRSYLDQAASLFHEAPSVEASGAYWLTEMGTRCQISYELYLRDHEPAMLAAAVDAARDAVDRVPADHADAAHLDNTLAVLLRQYSALSGDIGPRQEAVDRLRRVLHNDCPTTVLPTVLANLAGALGEMFDVAGVPELAHEAVAVARGAMECTSSSGKYEARFALADALKQLHGVTKAPDVYVEAAETLAAVAQDAEAPIRGRIAAYRSRAVLTASNGQPKEALDDLERAVSLLTDLAPLSLEREDREHRLSGVTGLGSAAAAMALRQEAVAGSNLGERAVELLEEARGLLLAEGLDPRGELSELRGHAPELAAEYDQIMFQIRGLNSGPYFSDADRTNDPASTLAWLGRTNAAALRSDRAKLAAAWVKLVARIRNHGFADFRKPASCAELRQYAGNDPVVYVTSESDGGHALIVTRAGVRVVDLPALTSDSLRRIVSRLLEAVTDQRLAGRIAAVSTVNRTLEWLWDAVVEPVMAILELPPQPGASGADLPHIWWCPAGLAVYLPLHAAGYHTRSDGALDESGRSTMDRAVSSYTPTILALGHARRTSIIEKASTVVVAMPDTPNAERLGAVAREAAELKQLIPSSVVLTNGQATRESVLAALQQCAVAHFACHGVGDASDPGRARLLLHDHEAAPLTVSQLSGLQLPLELAFLSACSTTQSAPWRVDEALHITGGFQLAGCRRVVGTLWPVADGLAADLAVAFYSRLTLDGSPDPSLSAIALHDAVVELRAYNPRYSPGWASHVHSGA